MRENGATGQWGRNHMGVLGTKWSYIQPRSTTWYRLVHRGSTWYNMVCHGIKVGTKWYYLVVQ